MTNITAARHNNLYARINNIIGNGAGRSGYGQGLGTGYGDAPESFAVSKLSDSDINLITAETLNAIYADILRCRVHQIGTEPTEIAELVANANIIAEDTSYEVTDEGVVVVDPDGTKKGILDFETAMFQVETNKFLVHTSQASVEPGITNQRTTPWNGLIYHEFTVTFRNADHRRHFFNTGGIIRISASNSAATNPKGLDWGQLCSSMGVIEFKYNETICSDLAITTAIGNYDLTTSYQRIFIYVGGGLYSGVYNSNLCEIKAKTVSDNVISFRIEFNDVASHGFADENVTGRLITTIQHYRADSEYISVPAPTYTNISNLS
jgi:hypothetical protein